MTIWVNVDSTDVVIIHMCVGAVCSSAVTGEVTVSY